MTLTTTAAATTNGAKRLIEWTSFHGHTGAFFSDARYVTCPNRGCGYGCGAPPQALPDGALHACRSHRPAWSGPRPAAGHCLAARGWRDPRRADARLVGLATAFAAMEFRLAARGRRHKRARTPPGIAPCERCIRRALNTPLGWDVPAQFADAL